MFNHLGSFLVGLEAMTIVGTTFFLRLWVLSLAIMGICLCLMSSRTMSLLASLVVCSQEWLFVNLCFLWLEVRFDVNGETIIFVLHVKSNLRPSLFQFFVQMMRSSLLFYALELVLVLELLRCPPPTPWIWYEADWLYRYVIGASLISPFSYFHYYFKTWF